MHYHSIKEVGLSSVLPNFKRYWIIFSYVAWFLLYYLFMTFSYDIILTLAAVLLGSFILAIVQGLFAQRVIVIIKYWILIVFSGVLTGLIWTVLFFLSLLLLLAGIAFIDTGSDTVSILLKLGLVDLGYAIIALGFTYMFWYKVVKPIYNSPRLSDRQRLLYEGFVTYAITIYVAITGGFIILLLFVSNFTLGHVLSALLSGWIFASLTYSGLQEIYEQNKFLKVFDEKIKKKVTEEETKSISEVDTEIGADPV